MPLTLAAVLLAGGCREATEVVVVVDSDLRLGVDFDVVNFVLFSVHSNVFPNSGGVQAAQGFVLPATLGVVPEQGGPEVFDVMAVAAKGFGPSTTVVTRRVSNVAFVPDERRALFISLLAQCRCNGTNCDIDPPCNDVVNPELTEFDEDHIPHL